MSLSLTLLPILPPDREHMQGLGPLFFPTRLEYGPAKETYDIVHPLSVPLEREIWPPEGQPTEVTPFGDRLTWIAAGELFATAKTNPELWVTRRPILAYIEQLPLPVKVVLWWH